MATVKALLDRGDIEVCLLGRRPNTLTELTRRGAQVAIGAQDDAKYLKNATRDVDALLWVTPPGTGSDDVRAFQNRLAKAGATAIRDNKIPRVVNLSSIGADHDSGVGLINGLHDVETILDEVASNITHLRPGFFFENLLMQGDSILKWGAISLPLSASRRFPMIATRDIGRVAADLLADPGWNGYAVRELHGPADLSFDEVAEIISGAMGRKITYRRCDSEETRQWLVSSGVSENAAELLLEMYAAAESGRLRPMQPRSEETTTPTTLIEFAHEVLLPSLAESVRH
jgi:uncharacterized protein YbjT (DUF2867 family)